MFREGYVISLGFGMDKMKSRGLVDLLMINNIMRRKFVLLKVIKLLRVCLLL